MMGVFVYVLLSISYLSDGVHTLDVEQDANMSSCIEKERQALLDVTTNLTDLHGNLTDWGSEGELDCCKWVGITCDTGTGHVTQLNLTFKISGLTGNIISPSLQRLSQLQDLRLSGINFQSRPLPSFLGSLSSLKLLDISGANLSGPIPPQLANLSNLLRLDLSHNALGGSIPFGFGNLTSLLYLDLTDNELEGAIPTSLGNCSSLLYLDLSQNLLDGPMPSVGKLSKLRYLDVGQNSLNGSIPNFIGCLSLSFLNMSNNRFLGNVPITLGQVSSLTLLDLSSNSLDGVISEVHFLNLTKLRYLDLSYNSLALDLNFHEKIPFQLSTIKLQSCTLGPRFPMWIRTQRDFAHLDISNAKISESVPTWFWDLPDGLEILNISSNQIKGILPDITSSFIGSATMDLSNNHFEGRIPLLPADLSALDLSGNRFSGTLSSLCEINRWALFFLDLSNNLLSGILPNDCWKNNRILKVLNLSNNNFSGEIPPSLGVFQTLEALYLRNNSFVGEIPMSLSNCAMLSFLDLRENKLSGVIRGWIGAKLSSLYVLSLGSNKFYGNLPSQICWLHNLQVLDLSNNQLSGDIPRCFDNFTAMARRSSEDDMTKHEYQSFLGVSFPIGVNNPPPTPPSKRGYFLDNALVTWKGKERSFERSGLQLLKSIDLSRNNLSGDLPDEIASLYDLASLNLSYNILTGQLPKRMGQLRLLQSLDLSRNEFSGNIPSSLAQLTFLSNLDVSYNNLSGRIPLGSQLQLFNPSIYSGNPQLCGPPLTPSCGSPPIVGNKSIEEEDTDSWKSFYTGMGAGFGVGFWGICGALFLNRRCRYLFFASLNLMKDWIYVLVVVNFGKLERKFSNFSK